MFSAKMLERAGDSKIRVEAEEIVDKLAAKASSATLYAGVARVWLDDERICLSVYDFKRDRRTRATADVRDGYFIIAINFPLMMLEVCRLESSMVTMTRSLIRRYLALMMKNVTFRSYLIHECVHVLARMKGLEYSSPETMDAYLNDHEEIDAHLNQFIYALVYKARASKFGPKRVLGHDAAEFVDRVVLQFKEDEIWPRLTEESKRRVCKRAYSGYGDALASC